MATLAWHSPTLFGLILTDQSKIVRGHCNRPNVEPWSGPKNILSTALLSSVQYNRNINLCFQGVRRLIRRSYPIDFRSLAKFTTIRLITRRRRPHLVPPQLWILLPVRSTTARGYGARFWSEAFRRVRSTDCRGSNAAVTRTTAVLGPIPLAILTPASETKEILFGTCNNRTVLHSSAVAMRSFSKSIGRGLDRTEPPNLPLILSRCVVLVVGMLSR